MAIALFLVPCVALIILGISLRIIAGLHRHPDRDSFHAGTRFSILVGGAMAFALIISSCFLIVVIGTPEYGYLVTLIGIVLILVGAAMPGSHRRVMTQTDSSPPPA